MFDVVLVDNADSFTINVANALISVGSTVTILPNTIRLSAVEELNPTHIVLSPGPGHASNDQDTGVCGQIIDRFEGQVPILGICLGMQLIGYTAGYRILPSDHIHHGQRSRIAADQGTTLHTGLPASFEVMCYHSFEVCAPEGDKLVMSRANDDGAVMSIESPTNLLFGVQYHPESVGSPLGRRVLANFLGGTA